VVRSKFSGSNKKKALAVKLSAFLLVKLLADYAGVSAGGTIRTLLA